MLFYAMEPPQFHVKKLVLSVSISTPVKNLFRISISIMKFYSNLLKLIVSEQWQQTQLYYSLYLCNLMIFNIFNFDFLIWQNSKVEISKIYKSGFMVLVA